MKINALGFGIIIICILCVIGGFSFPFKYYTESRKDDLASVITVPAPFIVTHIETPESVKALYMSNWVAGNKKLRGNLIDIIDKTELNSVVIDIKDYTGKIGFIVSDSRLKKFNSSENRISDIKEFIGELHEKGIYVIGRISSFQDLFFVKSNPEYAVKNKNGDIWKDNKGISWLDVGVKEVWEYLSLIGDEAYSVGFDELNFDYIRFPSDGNMNNIAYSFSKDKVKSEALKEFFIYISDYFHVKGIPISADLFGLTTVNTDDLGIGQILEDALTYFDFVSPMVYPSHYANNFNDWGNPAERPYDIVLYSMSRAVVRANQANISPYKLRPWLQDFSINGTTYTPDMVRAQIKATYDVGLNSWMLWNASNIYTVSALDLIDKK